MNVYDWMFLLGFICIMVTMGCLFYRSCRNHDAKSQQGLEVEIQSIIARQERRK